ncbi:1,4-beta cellobiohydrolase [Neocallimastix sp. 'constans']
MKFIYYSSILALTIIKYSNAACAGPYAQCEGVGFSGENCCQEGYKCSETNEWYSQCVPDVTIPESSATSSDGNFYNSNDNKNYYNDENSNYYNNEINNNYYNENNNIQSSNATSFDIQVDPKNFFQNEIYANPRFIEEVESSIPKLTELVKDVPTAVWLAWEGAPGEVAHHLEAAGSKTVVFILYMISTRDCNSLASAGGASSLETYKGYVDDISNTISQYPNTKVVMVVEPDTLGNLVTGSSEACKTVHTLHKNALSYAVDVFGNMENDSVYLDAAHGKWLSGVADKAAKVIKEVLDNAPNGKIRGLSTNISNYQSVYSEYKYHEKLNGELEKLGITGMRFIVDTGRNGVDITETFNINQTWCIFIGTGFGERPKGEADGSDTGSRADPVCVRDDSLPGSPDAGQWFHDYFVQLLENAEPSF